MKVANKFIKLKYCEYYKYSEYCKYIKVNIYI